MSNSYFRDHFVETGTKFGSTKLVNNPKVIYGNPISSELSEDGKNNVVEFETGIFYSRPTHYIDSSPYGWDYHSESVLSITDSRRNDFSNRTKIIINLHLIEMKRIFQKCDLVTTTETISKFKDKMSSVYKEFDISDNPYKTKDTYE